jgi:hypothetical protein
MSDRRRRGASDYLETALALRRRLGEARACYLLVCEIVTTFFTYHWFRAGEHYHGGRCSLCSALAPSGFCGISSVGPVAYPPEFVVVELTDIFPRWLVCTRCYALIRRGEGVALLERMAAAADTTSWN